MHLTQVKGFDEDSKRSAKIFIKLTLRNMEFKIFSGVGVKRVDVSFHNHYGYVMGEGQGCRRDRLAGIT